MASRSSKFTGRPSARPASRRSTRREPPALTATSPRPHRTVPVALAGPKARTGRRGRLLRGAALVGALAIVGTLYSFAVPSSSEAEDTAPTASKEDINAGQQMYENTCITCHGANLEGVKDRGPSLIGVGSASVYFQVATGRMPVARQEAQPMRKPPKYNEKESKQLGAYIQQFGGGPQIPTVSKESLAKADLGNGGQLFRLNCASCHNFSGQGGALSSGKYAPGLEDATPVEIYSAMLVGPQNMPVFSENQLTPDQKLEVIAYIQTLKATRDPGGAGIGRTGPVPEGLVIWLVGLSAVLVATVWIAGKS